MTDWYENTVRRYNPRELKPSDACVDMVTYFEGFEPNAYLDPVGIPTIGYGFVDGVKMGDTITLEAATERLHNYLTETYGYDVQRLVSVPLSQYEYDALVSWTYNLGSGNLASSTLLKKLNQGLYDEVPEQILRWDRAGGKVLRGLTIRRNAEARMFAGEDWENF